MKSERAPSSSQTSHNRVSRRLAALTLSLVPCSSEAFASVKTHLALLAPSILQQFNSNTNTNSDSSSNKSRSRLLVGPSPNGSSWQNSVGSGNVSPDEYYYDVSSVKSADPNKNNSYNNYNNNNKTSYSYAEVNVKNENSNKASSYAESYGYNYKYESTYFEPEVVSKKTTATPGTGEIKTDPLSAMKAGADLVFPDNFRITDHWSYLTAKQQICDTKDIPAQVAFQVVNKRGAIAHGRDPELNFDVLTMDENPFKTVKEVFDDLGGTKTLKGIDEIKRELMTRGPVVSTSFLLTQPFMAPRENANRFDPTLIGETYPVAIIGWEHTVYGEVWIIQPLIKQSLVDVQKIAFRQFGIDETVIAPTNSFENTPWQVGPYFDIDMSDTPFPEWVTSWHGVETAITSDDLEKLGKMLGSDFINASRQRTKFVIRDSKKIARSRACFLTKLEWQPGEKPWRMEVSYQ